MSTNNTREDLINRLLRLENDIDGLILQLQDYEWDYDGVPVLLEREKMIAILKRWHVGQIPTEALYQWADFIELREDIDFLAKDRELLSMIVHSLANPALEGEMTKEKCAEFLKLL